LQQIPEARIYDKAKRKEFETGKEFEVYLYPTVYPPDSADPEIAGLAFIRFSAEVLSSSH